MWKLGFFLSLNWSVSCVNLVILRSEVLFICFCVPTSRTPYCNRRRRISKFSQTHCPSRFFFYGGYLFDWCEIFLEPYLFFGLVLAWRTSLFRIAEILSSKSLSFFHSSLNKHTYWFSSNNNWTRSQIIPEWKSNKLEK